MKKPSIKSWPLALVATLILLATSQSVVCAPDAPTNGGLKAALNDSGERRMDLCQCPQPTGISDVCGSGSGSGSGVSVNGKCIASEGDKICHRVLEKKAIDYCNLCSIDITCLPDGIWTEPQVGKSGVQKMPAKSILRQLIHVRYKYFLLSSEECSNLCSETVDPSFCINGATFCRNDYICPPTNSSREGKENCLCKIELSCRKSEEGKNSGLTERGDVVCITQEDKPKCKQKSMAMCNQGTKGHRCAGGRGRGNCQYMYREEEKEDNCCFKMTCPNVGESIPKSERVMLQALHPTKTKPQLAKRKKNKKRPNALATDTEAEEGELRNALFGAMEKGKHGPPRSKGKKGEQDKRKKGEFVRKNGKKYIKMKRKRRRKSLSLKSRQVIEGGGMMPEASMVRAESGRKARPRKRPEEEEKDGKTNSNNTRREKEKKRSLRILDLKKRADKLLGDRAIGEDKKKTKGEGENKSKGTEDLKYDKSSSTSGSTNKPSTTRWEAGPDHKGKKVANGREKNPTLIKTFREDDDDDELEGKEEDAVASDRATRRNVTTPYERYSGQRLKNSMADLSSLGSKSVSFVAPGQTCRRVCEDAKGKQFCGEERGVKCEVKYKHEAKGDTLCRINMICSQGGDSTRSDNMETTTAKQTENTGSTTFTTFSNNSSHWSPSNLKGAASGAVQKMKKHEDNNSSRHARNNVSRQSKLGVRHLTHIAERATGEIRKGKNANRIAPGKKRSKSSGSVEDMSEDISEEKEDEKEKAMSEGKGGDQMKSDEKVEELDESKVADQLLSIKAKGNKTVIFRTTSSKCKTICDSEKLHRNICDFSSSCRAKLATPQLAKSVCSLTITCHPKGVKPGSEGNIESEDIMKEKKDKELSSEEEERAGGRSSGATDGGKTVDVDSRGKWDKEGNPDKEKEVSSSREESGKDLEEPGHGNQSQNKSTPAASEDIGATTPLAAFASQGRYGKVDESEADVEQEESKQNEGPDIETAKSNEDIAQSLGNIGPGRERSVSFSASPRDCEQKCNAPELNSREICRHASTCKSVHRETTELQTNCTLTIHCMPPRATATTTTTTLTGTVTKEGDASLSDSSKSTLNPEEGTTKKSNLSWRDGSKLRQGAAEDEEGSVTAAANSNHTGTSERSSIGNVTYTISTEETTMTTPTIVPVPATTSNDSTKASDTFPTPSTLLSENGTEPTTAEEKTTPSHVNVVHSRTYRDGPNGGEKGKDGEEKEVGTAATAGFSNTITASSAITTTIPGSSSTKGKKMTDKEISARSKANAVDGKSVIKVTATSTEDCPRACRPAVTGACQHHGGKCRFNFSPDGFCK